MLILADARKIPLKDETVQCVVTSPPYWGLRDYGVDGQLGLELTPEEYVTNMVEVFREVRRVLRDDGTLWLNMGDCYGQGHGGSSTERQCIMRKAARGDAINPRRGTSEDYERKGGLRNVVPGIKPKDLCGIPWRLAFALQADGWYLRSDIIWAKPNPMPESVTDRPTKSHEYIFLLTKRARYFFDAEAVREDAEYGYRKNDGAGMFTRVGSSTANPQHGACSVTGKNPDSGRNIRTVWNIATQPYSGAHFATFPYALVERCVKAGTSEHGCCTECGAPWRRVVEVGDLRPDNAHAKHIPSSRIERDDRDIRDKGWTVEAGYAPNAYRKRTTTGWRPTCAHDSPGGKCLVLDPFCGSGTTLRVAQRLGRKAIGLDISAEYLDMAEHRVASLKPPSDDQPSLF